MKTTKFVEILCALNLVLFVIMGSLPRSRFFELGEVATIACVMTAVASFVAFGVGVLWLYKNKDNNKKGGI